MDWKEIKTYKELYDLNQSWIAIATLHHDGSVFETSIYSPKNAVFRSRADGGFNIGARTLVLQIPEPKPPGDVRKREEVIMQMTPRKPPNQNPSTKE